MSGKTVTAQASPDPMPVAGQRPGPPFFAILIVAGLIVIGAGLRSIANIIGPLLLVITLVITAAPLRSVLVQRRWPSWLASLVSLATIYLLLGLILGLGGVRSRPVGGTLPDYANAFDQIYSYLLGTGLSSDREPEGVWG